MTAGSLALIQLSGVGFSYPGRDVLRGVDLSLSAASPSRKLGVVGENGVGKSTLMRVITGELLPGTGKRRVVGSCAVVEQELTFGEDERVGDLIDSALAPLREALASLEAATRDVERGDDREAGPRYAVALALAEHLGAWDGDRRIQEALTSLGAIGDRERKLAEMSVGERHRVRLACALAERADILLVDEPTNHLDAQGLEYLTETLKRWPGLAVIVTHDRQLLDDVVDQILDLDPSMDGKPVLYTAHSYSEFRGMRDGAMARWRSRYVAEQKRLVRLAAVLDASYEGLSDEWRPPKGSEKYRRATKARQHIKNADRQLEALKAKAVDVPVPPMRFAMPSLYAYDKVGERPVLVADRVAVEGRLSLRHNIIELGCRGRLLVVGGNGTGKSTLLNVLAGTVAPTSGSVERADGLRVGYLGQEDDGRHARELTGFEAYAKEAVRLLEAGRLDPERLVPIAFTGLFSEEDLERPLGELSVGARRRFDLACALLAAPHVLILDEPTNHLSVALVDDLTVALRRTDIAVIVATHDRMLRADLAHWPVLGLG